MAEGMMNPNGQDVLMLVQSFEQLAAAVGAEVPVAIQSEIAAVKAGNRMSPELQKILAEGSMQLMNQLNPDTMGDMRQSTGAAMTPRETTGAAMTPRGTTGAAMTPRGTTGAAMTPRETTGAAMTEEERMLMQNKMPSLDGMTYGPSSGVTVAPSNVMSMDDAIAAGLVNPTRPQARPTAPMQSMRPQMRR